MYIVRYFEVRDEGNFYNILWQANCNENGVLISIQ